MVFLVGFVCSLVEFTSMKEGEECHISGRPPKLSVLFTVCKMDWKSVNGLIPNPWFSQRVQIIGFIPQDQAFEFRPRVDGWPYSQQERSVQSRLALVSFLGLHETNNRAGLNGHLPIPS
jgi:hypothetical protein